MKVSSRYEVSVREGSMPFEGWNVCRRDARLSFEPVSTSMLRSLQTFDGVVGKGARP